MLSACTSRAPGVCFAFDCMDPWLNLTQRLVTHDLALLNTLVPRVATFLRADVRKGEQNQTEQALSVTGWQL